MGLHVVLIQADEDNKSGPKEGLNQCLKRAETPSCSAHCQDLLQPYAIVKSCQRYSVNHLASHSWLKSFILTHRIGLWFSLQYTENLHAENQSGAFHGVLKFFVDPGQLSTLHDSNQALARGRFTQVMVPWCHHKLIQNNKTRPKSPLSLTVYSCVCDSIRPDTRLASPISAADSGWLL